ncbi:MAG TPA: PAS domain S-box protein [Bacteroidales bacterium]|nr:PAS domain S-box protein [Bacteroidales bacterium]
MDSENFKNLFNAIHDFLFILDLKGNILEVNKAVNIFLGYDNIDLKGKSVLLVHPSEYREKAAEIVGQMLAGLAEKCPLPLLSKSGKHIPVETKIYHGHWNDEQVLIGISRNMSDIALSEEKFFSVFDNSQALMAVSEIESGIFVNVNKVFLNVLGFEKSEIIGRNSKELNLFYDYKQREKLAEKSRQNSVIENEHVIVRTKDGRPLHCLFSITRIQIQTYQYLLTSAIDISSLVLSERKLKRNLEQQRLLADISQNFLSLDRFCEKIRNTLQLLGEHTGVSRVYIFQDLPDGLQTCNTFEWCKPGLKGQIEGFQMPYELVPSWKKILNENGKVFSTHIKELPADLVAALEPQGIKSILVFPLFVQNRFFGFIGFDECEHDKEWEEEEVELLRTIAGIISNSFERQTFQKQLTESEIRQKLALENTEAGLWDWNIQTGDVYYSEIWCNMLGYSHYEIEPSVKSWKELLHPDDLPSVLKTLNRHLHGKTEFYQSTHRLLTKTGDWKWVIDKGKVIEFDENGKPKRAIGTHIDISNQKAIEEELRNLNVTKDKLFSIIAHDLRGPIGTMMQISEMVTEKGGMDDETLYNFLHSQKELTENTFQLLENLLNWARFNSERIQFKPKSINLNTIIDENLTSIKFRAGQKGISLVSEFTDSYSAFADEDMVKLVIRNLLSNALKFTGRNGSIRIELEKTNHTVEVKISDTGTGISDENISKILSENVFYSTSGTANEKGSGLGLKLCRNFITQNKGKFIIESKINTGSTFTFTLPEIPVSG